MESERIVTFHCTMKFSLITAAKIGLIFSGGNGGGTAFLKSRPMKMEVSLTSIRIGKRYLVFVWTGLGSLTLTREHFVQVVL